MTGGPLCSVITPTWQRYQMLLDRCIPSVQAQGYPWVEHLVISDGPDPVLREVLSASGQEARGWKGIRYAELAGHDPSPHYGHLCRIYGIAIAMGEYVTYCDDDDALRPVHCHVMAAALDENPEAGFAVSRMVSHGPGGESVIGHGPLACGNVGTPMLMHRREIADVATWGEQAGEHPVYQFEDWDLTLRWMNAGIQHIRVDLETSDVWPSLYR